MTSRKISSLENKLSHQRVRLKIHQTALEGAKKPAQRIFHEAAVREISEQVEKLETEINALRNGGSETGDEELQKRLKRMEQF